MVRHNKREEIGQMRERPQIQAATQSRGSDGSDVETWAELATVWAAVEYRALTSNESLEAGKEVAKTEIVFRIRKRTDVTTRNRILHGSVYYDIESIEVTPDQQYMNLVCKAVGL